MVFIYKFTYFKIFQKTNFFLKKNLHPSPFLASPVFCILPIFCIPHMTHLKEVLPPTLHPPLTKDG